MIAFPVLLYPDEGRWVGLSLLTSTVAVAASPDAAFDDVLDLLTAELETAVGDKAKESLSESLEAIMCVAEPRFWALFYTRATGSKAGVINCTLTSPVPVPVRSRTVLSALPV